MSKLTVDSTPITWLLDVTALTWQMFEQRVLMLINTTQTMSTG
ncbi:hypothetical protein [Acinetobacter baumannii]|nr:hypothetical protein [Acinetobacter baumannii]